MRPGRWAGRWNAVHGLGVLVGASARGCRGVQAGRARKRDTRGGTPDSLSPTRSPIGMRRGHLRGLSRLIAVSRLPGLTRPTKAACSNQPLQVSVKAPIVRAITTLSRFNVGSLLVHSDGEVIGVLTERDVMRNVRPRCSAMRATTMAWV